MPKQLAEEWARFERLVLPENVPSIQRSEMRKAFYAGASSFFGILTRGADGNVTEEEDQALLSSLALEIRDFVLTQGRDGSN